jgi:3-dehydro-L-gulonate 2-dehydrogenase
LPIGFWKGSGLALVLDLVAAILSGGHATYQVPMRPEEESGLSQVFIAVNPSMLGESDEAASVADRIIEHLHGPLTVGETVRYPGERTLEIRRRNLEQGIPVEPSVWQLVEQL